MTDAERDSKYLTDKLVTMGVLTRFQANDVEKVLEDYIQNGIPVDELPEEISDDSLIPKVGDWVRIKSVEEMESMELDDYCLPLGDVAKRTFQVIDSKDGCIWTEPDGWVIRNEYIAEINPSDYFEMHHNYSEDHVKGESVMHPYPAQKDQWTKPKEVKPKFKVGDTVRVKSKEECKAVGREVITEPLVDSMYAFFGKLDQVEHFDENGNLRVHDWWWHPDMLELVSPSTESGL